MKLRILFLSLMFLFLSSGLLAQVDEFTQENFLEEMKEFLGTSLKKEEMKNVFDTLSLNWTSGKIDEGYQFGIALTSIMLKKKHAKKNTDFYNYFRTINGFVAYNKMDDYMAWEVALVGLVQSVSISKISKYLEFSSGLVADNILTHSSSSIWFTTQKSFFIENNLTTEQLDVTFDKLDLACGNKKDTFYIEGTKGIYYPSEKKWVGKGGKVTWERAGLNPNNVYVEIQGKYELDLKTGKIIIDSVLFTNSDYDQIKILGQLENNLMSISKLEKSPDFPRFSSYEKDISLTDIFPQIDYIGGFSMIGDELIGEGTIEQKAKMIFKKNNKQFIETEALRYVILKDEIKAYSASANIKLDDKTEITHKNVKLNYKTDLSSKGDQQMYKYMLGWDDKGNVDSTLAANTSMLSLTRATDKASNIPFIDNYHNLNIYCSQLIWIPQDSLIYVYTSPATRDKVARFESKDYFSMEKFQEFDDQGVNHLIAVQRMTLSKYTELKYALDSREFTPDDYTFFINYHYKKNYRVEAINLLLAKMADNGYIEYAYNGHGMIAMANQKLYDFVLYRTKYHTIERGKDFDNIDIISELNSPAYGINATINLKNLDLKIFHSQPVWLSRGKKVAFESDQIIVKQNRNMTFGGNVYAGDTFFEGSSFTFNYETFDIEINKESDLQVVATVFVRDEKGNKVIDSLKTYSQDNVSKDTIWAQNRKRIESKIEGIRGNIKIDATDNKSGMFAKKEYPMFKSIDTSTVYYDKTIGDRYTRDKFMFENYGMNIDSLNNITEKAIDVRGKFISNIFPEFTDTLSLGSDGVLGLETDSSGIAIHDGLYLGKVELNKKGLRGKGVLKYLTTTASSELFIFYPDSIVGTTSHFDAKKLEQKDIPTVDAAKGEFMKVEADIIDYAWLFKRNSQDTTIFEDYLRIKNKHVLLKNQFNIEYYDNTDPIKIYKGTLVNGEAFFNGRLYFKQEGIEAKGQMDFIDAKIDSDTIYCKASEFRAPISDFILKEKNDITKNAFEVKNINTFVNIETQQGIFTTNDDDSKIEFPTNQYTCQMDHFVWNIGKGILNIGGTGLPGLDSALVVDNVHERDSLRKAGNENVRLSGTILSSLKKYPDSPDDEGLTFEASSAVYNIDKTLIIANNVNDINVADAIIHPTSSVKINPKAIIDTLYGTTIDVNTRTFFDANVSIEGKNTYNAKGKSIYPFNNQEIEFQKIFVVKDSTVAYAKLQNLDSISLNDNFVFKGALQNDDITMYGNRKDLYFKGKAKIAHTCQNIASQSVEFDAYINSDDVYIPIGKEIKNSSTKLYAGFYIASAKLKPENHPYGTFITPLNKDNDSKVLSAEGFLNFNKKSGRYEIAEKHKIQNHDTLGNIISFSPGLCFVYGEGILDFNVLFGEVKHKIVGTAINNPYSGVTFNTMIGFEFFFANSLLKIMEESINLIPLDPMDNTKSKYKQKLKMWVGEKDAEKIITKIDNGLYEGFPKQFESQTLMFADVSFKWDSTRNSYISYGKLGLSNLAGNQINGYVDGIIEMRVAEAKNAGLNNSELNELSIFINPYKGTWYYFQIKGGKVMNVIAKDSDNKFNNAVATMKNKERKKGGYQFTLIDQDSGVSTVKKWLRALDYEL